MPLLIEIPIYISKRKRGLLIFCNLNCQFNKSAEMSSDLDRQIEQLRKCEIIKETEVKALCAKAREILVEESNVQRVDAPVTVLVSFFSL